VGKSFKSTAFKNPGPSHQQTANSVVYNIKTQHFHYVWGHNCQNITRNSKQFTTKNALID
jgi:hypothetical protein